ncbi:hypothetical protein DFJ69_3996 [Thermomonospora umbrina]|uniref:Uncharacterized protein n=2 Tax=Thermomonospora umbrina TaxID=111806 RepID=A0A3D9SRC8_9ACTN|nr:hypothetical protein DFJ69_3996 [Thermomonospora umbrina]
MNDDLAVTDDPTGPIPQVNGFHQTEGPGVGPPGRPSAPAPAGHPHLPEVEVPAPEGRTEFSATPHFSASETSFGNDAADDWRPAGPSRDAEPATESFPVPPWTPEDPTVPAWPAGQAPEPPTPAEAPSDASTAPPSHNSWFERPDKPTHTPEPTTDHTTTPPPTHDAPPTDPTAGTPIPEFPPTEPFFGVPPSDATPAADTPVAQSPFDGPPVGGAPFNEGPVSEPFFGVPPSDATPGADAPVAQSPFDGPPVGGAPFNEGPASESFLGGPPSDSAPAVGGSVALGSFDAGSASESSFGGRPSDVAPAAGRPVAQGPFDGPPADGASFEEGSVSESFLGVPPSDSAPAVGGPAAPGPFDAGSASESSFGGRPSDVAPAAGGPVAQGPFDGPPAGGASFEEGPVSESFLVGPPSDSAPAVGGSVAQGSFDADSVSEPFFGGRPSDGPVAEGPFGAASAGGASFDEGSGSESFLGGPPSDGPVGEGAFGGPVGGASFGEGSASEAFLGDRPADGEAALGDDGAGVERGVGGAFLAEEAGDVRVAPVAGAGERSGAEREQERSGWEEGSLFDGAEGDDGEGVPDYAPVDMSGPGTPPKPGKPSSGNWRMPDWIDEEAREHREGRSTRDIAADYEGGKGSRVGLIAGVSVLVVALAVAGGYFYLQRGDDKAPADTVPSAPAVGLSTPPVGRETPPAPQTDLPPDKAMPRFSGRPTRTGGAVADRRAGLAYPRFAAPWRPAAAGSRLSTKGWSGQQVLVEGRGGTSAVGRLLTGVLPSSAASEYRGPDDLKPVTARALDMMIKKYHPYRHKGRPLASQPLAVGGRKGWLMSSYLTFKRPGVRATGEVVAVAVIDTGRAAPAVAFASLPNTHRRYWPDITVFLTRLKPVTATTE